MRKLHLLLVSASLGACTVGAPTADPAGQDVVQDVEALSMLRSGAGDVALAGDDQLVERESFVDELGQRHTRFDRVFRGLRVVGGDLVAHPTSRKAADSALRAPLRVSLKARKSASEASAAAAGAFKGRLEGGSTAELVVDVDGAGVARLAYEVISEGTRDDGTPSIEHAFVDASTGAVFRTDDEIKTAAATGTGYSLYVGTVSIGTNTRSTGGYELRDVARPGFASGASNYTINMGGGTSGGSIFTDSDNVWGNGTTSSSQSAAVDAHFGMARTWDYYYNTFGRRGIANTGGGTYSRVHYSTGYDNAFWSDSCFCMTYGDGSSFKPLVALDVAGHEMTHGVTSRTAGLQYSGESGGLNESMSDVFGTMVEFYVNSASDVPDYLIGEKISKTGTPLRYMDHPRNDGRSIDHYSQYYSGLDVHYSSGLANNAFYLAAHGGTNDTSGIAVTSIGRAAAQKIWYRALTVYMTSTTGFRAARTATLNAAADLYGSTSTQYAGVANAWRATGVN